MTVDNLISINPLDIHISSKFMINDTMEALMNALLLENQTVNVSYNQYYNKCSPLFCTYDIQQRFDLIFLMTSIAAMYAVLSKFLRLILPMLVHLIFIAWKRFRSQDLSTNQSTSIIQNTHCNIIPDVLFFKKMDSKFKSLQQSISSEWVHLVQVFRDFSQGNGLISSLGTNVEMKFGGTDTNGHIIILPKTYKNGTCSCATSNSCTTDLINATCLGSGHPDPNSCSIDILPLQFSSSVSNFAINDQIETIVNRAFIDFWSNDTSYEQYYTACAPISCSYVKQQHVNLVYALTMLLNVFSGLSVVLKYIVPLLVGMASKLRSRFKSSRVSPSY
ncbi:unnamed protein product [Rotaria sp. Silwood2]|nr:unnamed protein product [Rotaria sp. Silwood2]CAF3217017.1 unnamed protein product [Rotaria sp. Silwood2]CAF4284668.1 unnamed protein product [Rotaria sp. Silwood2]CAF4537594.1 unnamed protein product [Rotaria sp. Silwood2]